MSRQDKLIDKLFLDKESRAIARAWVAHFEVQPMMADRIEPLLREAARGDAMVRDGSKTQEEAQAYLRSFAGEALGTPGHLVDAMASWTPPAPDAAPAETPQQAAAQPAQPTAAVPAPQPAPAATAATLASADAARASRDLRISEIESKHVRAPQGSPEWQQYYRDPKGAMKTEYLELLQARETGQSEAAPAQSAPGNVQ